MPERRGVVLWTGRRCGTGGRGGVGIGRSELLVSKRACVVGALALVALVLPCSVAAAWASAGPDPLVSLGRLSASDAPQTVFQSAGLSGPVAVAANPPAADGAVYVYVERSGGWSTETESAKLIAADGQGGPYFGDSVAISGDTVLVSGSSGLYVFTKPPGGWSGTIHESTKLTFANPAGGPAAFAISGDTIVAGDYDPDCSCHFAGYVFTKPAGGWSGTIHESATLTIPNASYPCFTSVAVDGSTIAATCSHDGYVFTKPTGGWSGTIQPSAALPPSPSTKPTFAESVAVLGSTIAVASGGGHVSIDPALFNQPPSGWSGTIQPSARLKLATASGDAIDEKVVGSGNTIATLVTRGDPICAGNPCPGTLYGFRQPYGGWSGTITGPSTTIEFPYVLATDQGTIAAGGSDAVDLFTIKPGAPSAPKVSLSDLAIGRPTLHLTLDAGQSAPPIRTLQLTLPRGLRFTDHRRGVRLSASTQRVRLRPGTLTITLRRPAQSLVITIGRPAITEQNDLRAKAQRIRRYNRTHHRRSLTIAIRLVVTDTTNHSTRLALTTHVP